MAIQQSFGKALIIGLGGTGQKALLQIKKYFQDSCRGVLPPCIKLLEFDTDQPELSLRDVHGNRVELTPSEFCRLSVSSVGDAIKSPYVKPWWISFPKINSLAVTAGAGGVREIGRLSLFTCIDQVSQQIETAFNEMNQYAGADKMAEAGFRLLEQVPQVIVIGSLAGGTGGGLFFDMSILCRALGGAEAKYMGIVMMPWVYQRLANTAYENTYAALLEYNRLAQLSAERPYGMRYSETIECTVTEPPFHVFNLVDGQCNNGERIAKAGDLVRFIGESVFHLTGAVGTKANSVYDNIVTLRLSVSDDATNGWDGMPVLYSAIGVSRLRYPGPEWHQYFSHLRTSEILAALAAESNPLAPSDSADKSAADKADVAPKLKSPPLVVSLIEKHRLQPEHNGLPEAMLPAKDRPSVALTNDDFESLDSRQDVVQFLKDHVDRAEEQAAAACQEAGAGFAEKVIGEFDSTVDKLPESQRLEARLYFRAHLEFCIRKLNELAKEANEAEKDLNAEIERALEQLPVELKVFRIPGQFRSRARNYARLVDERLQNGFRALAVRAAAEVCNDLFGGQHAAGKTAEKLSGLAAEYQIQADSWNPARLRGANKFESVIGVDEAPKGTAINYFEKTNSNRVSSRVPEAAELRRDLPDECNPLSKKLGKDPVIVAQDLFQWVFQKLAFVRDLTALDALEVRAEINRGTPTEEVESVIKRALQRATLLLPLREGLLNQNGRCIKEHLVIGVGVSPSLPETQHDGAFNASVGKISSVIPSTELNWAQFTLTTEPNLITITHYKAVFPLHAINGVADLRRAYESRFLPPSHIDRRQLFMLDDPMPQSDTHPLALKVLTLAMLPFVHLIWQERRAQESGKYFAHSPDLSHELLATYDAETHFPGLPGKFYSLVDELSREHFRSLLREIERALLAKAASFASQPDQLAAFFEDVRSQRDKFQKLVDNMAGDARHDFLSIEGTGRIKGQFNRMVTGHYYRRQADFLRRVHADRERLARRITESDGKNLIGLLLEPSEGLKI